MAWDRMKGTARYGLRIHLLAMGRLLYFLVFPFILSSAVYAHGGGTTQLANEPAGPYLLSVWTEPSPARTGDVHITVAVAEPGGGQAAGPPVLGAAVYVRMVPQDGQQAAVTAQATNEASANKLFYEAHLDVPTEGLWAVHVSVDGPQGSGEAQFNLMVEPPGVNWSMVATIVVAVVVLALTVRRLRET